MFYTEQFHMILVCDRGFVGFMRTCLECKIALYFGSVVITKKNGKFIYTDSGKVILPVSNNKRVDTNWIIYQCSNNSNCVHQ